MQVVFRSQPREVQDFLTHTAELRILDPGAIKSVLSIPDPNALLASLSTNYPAFLNKDQSGRFHYREHLHEFLIDKFERTLSKPQRQQLHLGFAAYFSEQGQWRLAIEHYLKAEEWRAASDLIHGHADQLLENEKPEDLRCLIEGFPDREVRAHGPLTRFCAQLFARLGNLQAAISSYQNYLGENQVSGPEAIEVAQFYQELAELHRRNGDLGDALGCLQMGAHFLEQGNGGLEAVEALRSIETLQQQPGTGQATLSWGNHAPVS